VPGGSFEFFDHSADVGISVQAESLEGLFELAGNALMCWMGPEPQTLPTGRIAVNVEAQDGEELMVRWLQELLFLFQHRHGYFLGTEHLSVSGNTLSAEVIFRVWGESEYQDYQEVKAVTYHQLSVRREGTSWHARFILDI